MPAKKYIIILSAEEREKLERVCRSHRHSAREKKRARILLMADTGVSHAQGGSWADAAIAQKVECDVLTVERVRQRAFERGALASLKRQEQQNRKARALDGAGEAALLAITCSTPPDGAARWSLRLLRERLIEMEMVENIGQETIRSTLKKTPSSRG
jgi:hypothetical protein